MSDHRTAEVLTGLAKDAYFGSRGLQLSEEQCAKFSL
jgi:hypothetical protein